MVLPSTLFEINRNNDRWIRKDNGLAFVVFGRQSERIGIDFGYKKNADQS